jgi:hypothetical protein
MFALVIQSKTFNYVISLAPLFAILLAAGVDRLSRALAGIGRVAVLLILGVTLAQGANAIVQMQVTASQRAPAEQLLQKLNAAIPPQARVFGHNNYWLGLSNREYRAVALLFYLSDPNLNRAPVSLSRALDIISPQIVLMDPPLAQIFADRSTPELNQRADDFWSYMQAHHARIISQLQDGQGQVVQVYQLDQQ